MKLTFAVLCDYASVSENKKVSISGIFSMITGSRFPAKHPRFYVASQLELTEEEATQQHSLGIEIHRPDGENLERLAADMPGQILDARPGVPIMIPIIAEINDVTFPVEGDYKVRVLINGDVLGEQTIYART